jgi:hypothetical protein
MFEFLAVTAGVLVSLIPNCDAGNDSWGGGAGSDERYDHF